MLNFTPVKAARKSAETVKVSTTAGLEFAPVPDFPVPAPDMWIRTPLIFDRSPGNDRS